MTDQIERRPVGRPPNRAEAVQAQRRRRKGMGMERNLKLHVPESAKDPNYTYRWVNDRPGRIRNLTQQDDYDVVSSAELTGDDSETDNTRSGDKFTGEKMVLLKKPKALYDADKAEEQKLLDERDKLLRKSALPDPQGASENAYTPGGRNIIAGK